MFEKLDGSEKIVSILDMISYDVSDGEIWCDLVWK